MRSTPYHLIPATVVVAIAAWSTCRIEGAASRVPDDAAWRAAAAAVRERHQRGDLIVFAPEWVDPVGRLHLGDRIPIEMAGRMDGERYANVWELAVGGARAPETRGLTPAWQGGFAGLAVRYYTRTPADVATDFVATFASMRAEGGPARGPSVELAEVGFAPRRCVQVVPQPGRSVTMTWPDVELGRELVGYVGLADVFTRRDVRDPGDLAVAIDGRQRARLIVGVDDGWVRFAATTTPGRATVTFTATAGPKARDRLICFAAEARR